MVLPHSASTHRFYEFTVVHQVPLVFDLVGCHPRLDLIPKTLDQKNKNGGRAEEAERERDGDEHMQRLGFSSQQASEPHENRAEADAASG